MLEKSLNLTPKSQNLIIRLNKEFVAICNLESKDCNLTLTLQ